MDIILLLAGFITLLVSGEILVRGGVSIARHLRVSKLVIGMTLVSLGTSAPELVVSLQSVLSGHSDVSTGTVIGSNMSNIGFILGLTILILPLPVHKQTIRFDAPFMLVATALLWLFISNLRLSWWEGLFSIMLLLGYIVYSIRHSRRTIKREPEKQEPPRYRLGISILMALVAVFGLRFGASWLVDGATGLARHLGVSEYVISITVIAVGTSLPELATSAVAALRKETDISIGNIVGSNLFNILGILGVTTLFSEIDVNEKILRSDIFWLLGISVMLFIFILPVRSGRLQRWEGGLLLLTYALYIFFVLT